ncbi:MAG TPA: hypothetical protein VGX50_08465, partial [Longimicrobium sp.]|nr:hypothetical protein [Longimicrobium sp.]
MLDGTRSPAPPGRGMWKAALLLGALLPGGHAAAQSCANTTEAYVSAIDQPIWYNRLGAHEPNAMMFALDEDVVYDGRSGRYRLRPGKRPRPLTLRVNEGDCLLVYLQNRLSPTPLSNQPGTREVGIHVTGMQVVDEIGSDGTN